MARYMLLNNASSVGNTALAFVTFRNPRLKFSMELVVYMIFRISSGYLKYVANCAQLVLHELTEDGYFLPHVSSRSFNASNAASSVGA